MLKSNILLTGCIFLYYLKVNYMNKLIDVDKLKKEINDIHIEDLDYENEWNQALSRVSDIIDSLQIIESQWVKLDEQFPKALLTGFMYEKEKLSEKFKKEWNNLESQYYAWMADWYREALSWMY